MASKIVAVYSKLYLGENDSSWYASPSSRLLGDLMKGYETARWIATITGPSGTARIALGDPVPNSYRNNDLYVPPWLLSTIGVEGVGEEIKIKFERCEDFQKATLLRFTYLGEIPSDIDLRDLLEHPLSQLGILSQGQIIPAPVLEGSLVVTHVEPEGAPVFLDGNEVAFEIDSDKKEIITPEPPAPTPTPPQIPQQMGSGMLPPSMQPGRYVTPTTSSRGRFANKSSFIPFAGQGRTLGS